MTTQPTRTRKTVAKPPEPRYTYDVDVELLQDAKDFFERLTEVGYIVSVDVFNGKVKYQIQANSQREMNETIQDLNQVLSTSGWGYGYPQVPVPDDTFYMEPLVAKVVNAAQEAMTEAAGDQAKFKRSMAKVAKEILADVAAS